jgi:ABC-type nitrate/sulfonate/bicarbonate transport system substrate-binding protein
MRRLAFQLFFCSVGVIAVFFAGPVHAVSKLRVGYGAVTATMAPLWAADNKGFFKKYGIDAELIYLAGGSRIALAVESDSIQLGRFSVNAGVEARLAGGDIVTIGSFYDIYYFQIFGKPTLRGPADLKGKVIAASTPGSASDYGIREALESFGLSENAYKIIYSGGTEARVHALQQGLADAAIISPPNGLIAQKLGFKELVNLMDMKIPFGYAGIAAKESWIRQNRDTLRNFFKAYLEALAILRRDSEYALAIISKFSRLNDREILMESYRTSIPQMSERPYVKREIIEKALKVSKKEAARRAEPEKFYDNSVIRELEESGFINSVFGKN